MRGETDAISVDPSINESTTWEVLSKVTRLPLASSSSATGTGLNAWPTLIEIGAEVTKLTETGSPGSRSTVSVAERTKPFELVTE